MIFLPLYDILCALCFLLCMFVHFMPVIVYVCTALLPLGVIKDNNGNNSYRQLDTTKIIYHATWRVAEMELTLSN